MLFENQIGDALDYVGGQFEAKIAAREGVGAGHRFEAARVPEENPDISPNEVQDDTKI